jgi:tRNA dimethylallyltransferase
VCCAFEVFEATGRLAEWQTRPPAGAEGQRSPPLSWTRRAPARPHRRRFETMVEQGLAEGRNWRLDPALPAAKLLGLRPLQALAAGTLTREEALDAAITATRQFAKRQMTWFRHRMAHYIWFDPFVSNLITQYGLISA